MNRRSRERWGVLLIGLVFMIGFYVLWRAMGAAAIVPALSLVFTTLVFLAFDFKRSIRRDVEQHAAQVRQYVGLHAALMPDQPLPPLGVYAIEADCASLLAQHILQHRPRLIVEAGSGSSTIVAAYCLRRIGEGKLVALEDQPAFAEFLRRDLEQRGLGEFAEVRDARFPALPVLADQLSSEAWVICDDANRRGERRALDRWKELFPQMETRILPTKKGTAVIEFKHGS